MNMKGGLTVTFVLECPDCHGIDFKYDSSGDDGNSPAFICSECGCVIEQAVAGDELVKD